ncbi:hypothetical protein G6F63_015340 [Rhizopus arrhizus]|nr:hypothetical protein G6F63_015340 [Rhizopus arrhizus]
MRPPLEPPSGWNSITPCPGAVASCAAPSNCTCSCGGTSPTRWLAPSQRRRAGSMTKRCGSPRAIACARTMRSWLAMSLPALRSCMPETPRDSPAAVISPMAAISAITSSISSSDSPAARLPCRRGRGSRRGRKYVMQDQGW